MPIKPLFALILLCSASSHVLAQTNAQSQSQAHDLEAGGKLYQKLCRTCHGPTAKGMASFPKLVGQSAEYLQMRLQQYRRGEKVGANTALMAPRAADLSDEDIANITSYITENFD